ncbi:MAG TPA: histidinol-phosphatase HisJ family protein [Candidatus Mediterraneibacter ornithocaccae]|nr:histidinol-phosphatase HisJ family protein [Candidatus Mediterraneibacter ornithocaccae]
MIQGDFHMHTEFSTDSDASVRSMLDASVDRGIQTVCITDHLDLDYPPDEELGSEPFRFDLKEYFAVLTQIREEYRGRLDVRIGVELGLQPHLGRTYEELVREYPFDFVIGSLHLVHGMDPYYGKVFEGRTDGEVYRDAFCETLRCLESVSSFDVLGHLDYVVRYGRNKAQEYSYREFSDEIDEILKKVISGEKGLEMNMGGIKYGLGFTNPHPDVLKRYRELGGEIVTVGADAHRPEHVAYDFEEAGEILKSCGFHYYAEFRERRPVFKKIP